MRRGSGTCWCGAPIFLPSDDGEPYLLAVPRDQPTRTWHEPAACRRQFTTFQTDELPEGARPPTKAYPSRGLEKFVT